MKGQPLGGGLAKLGQDVVIFGIRNMAAVVRDKQRWAFGCYLVHLFFNRQRFRTDIIKSPACSNTRPLK